MIILKVSQDTGTVSQRLVGMKRRRMRKKGVGGGEWVDGGWGLDTSGGGGEGEPVSQRECPSAKDTCTHTHTHTEVCNHSCECLHEPIN